MDFEFGVFLSSKEQRKPQNVYPPTSFYTCKNDFLAQDRKGIIFTPANT